MTISLNRELHKHALQGGCQRDWNFFSEQFTSNQYSSSASQLNCASKDRFCKASRICAQTILNHVSLQSLTLSVSM